MSAGHEPAADRLLHVMQGEHAVSGALDLVLTAVLGSCVSACMWDPVARIGGMNHFLLTEPERGRSESVVYGAQAMEILIDALLGRGAQRSRLQAKLFGGARITEGLTDIGRINAEFAQRFLRGQGIPCVGASLGGDRARRVRFRPASGEARQLLIGAATDVILRRPRPQTATGDIALF